MRVSNLVMLALLATSAANAAPVTYDLTGTVNQVGTTTLAPVTVGQDIPIVITLDNAVAPNTSGTTYSSLDSALVLSATFAGENEGGLIQTVTIDPGSLFQINTVSPQVGAGFTLALSSPVPGALLTSAIPASLDPADFGRGTFSVTEAFSPSEFGFSGTIDGLASGAAAVPEPASLALLGAAVIGSMAWRRRT